MLIEAMSCGLPVIATRSGGPVSFVNTDRARPNGWLIEPDDPAGLEEALVDGGQQPDMPAAARRQRLPPGTRSALVGCGRAGTSRRSTRS